MFDERLKSLFLRELSEYPNITVAARAVGVSVATVYKHRKDDPLFAERMQEALDESVDLLEHEAHRRAFQGVEKPVFYRDQEIAKVREYSDGLAMFLLKAHRPNKYRERSEVAMSGNLSVTVMTGVPDPADGSDLV